MSRTQEDTTHFERSARSVAFEKSIYLTICIFGFAMFAGTFFLVENLPTLALLGLGFGATIAAVIAFIVFGEIRRVLQSGEEWRVSVSDEMLTWHSPVEKDMKSFSIALSDIEAVQEHVTRFRNSDRMPDRDFSIRLLHGDSIQIDEQCSGIHPLKVFQALEKRGITFDKTDEWQGSNVKTVTSD